MSRADLDADGPDPDRPRLTLVATPIGHAGDISERALEVLRTSDVIACEDTRVTRQLLKSCGIEAPRLIACHDHNEAQSAAGIVKLIEEGASVALVSDAGTPGISDPGFRVVRACLDAGLDVTGAPGPVSPILALTLSGLASDRFIFLGFPPRKSGKRQAFLTPYAELPATLIMMESPQRLGETVADALAVLGDRPAALAMELTKTYERVFREPLSALQARLAEAPRGEATLLIEGARDARARTNKYAAFSKAPPRG